ncbi:MAG: YcxB family protein [Coriobacteriales bacterium]|nr:YcxB family protein [Coriobacteriales bacterium]
MYGEEAATQQVPGDSREHARDSGQVAGQQASSAHAPQPISAAQTATSSGSGDEPAEQQKRSGPRLDLQATITEEDLFNFNRAWAHVTGERGRSVWMWRAWGLIPIVGGGVIIFLGDYVLGGALVALGVVLAAGAGFYHRASVRRAVAKQASGRNPAMLGPRRVVIDQTGIFEGGRYDRLQVAWPGVVDLVLGQDAFYVFYGTMQAVIVPKRAFRSAADFERAVGLVERYIGRRATNATKA